MLAQDPKALQRDLATRLHGASDASIPEILGCRSADPENSADDVLLLSLQVDADLPCFRGHFPGNPVLPGVVQLQWAVEITRLVLDLARPPRQVLRLKFKSIVVPPERIELRLTQRTATDVAFSYFSEDRTYSQGLLRFDENGQ